MNPLRWLTISLLALALVAGAVFLLQRQVSAQLRDELSLLREERSELARLWAERARLQAVQPSPEELQRLRDDRSAVERLRGELGLLQIRTQAMARAAERAALPLTPTANLGDAGRATPAAAVETIFWAAAHHDVGRVAGMLSYDPELRAAAEVYFAKLPEATRQKYGSVDGLLGQFTADELNVAAMRVVQQDPATGEGIKLLVRTQNEDGFARERPFTLTQRDGSWGLDVSQQMVQRIADRLRTESAAGN